MKDLVDLALIGDLAELDAARLREALESTFAGRATQPLPSAVPTPPQSWARPYGELAQAVGIPPNLNEGYTAAAGLLDPILASGPAQRWDPKTKRWL